MIPSEAIEILLKASDRLIAGKLLDLNDEDDIWRLKMLEQARFIATDYLQDIEREEKTNSVHRASEQSHRWEKRAARIAIIRSRYEYEEAKQEDLAGMYREEYIVKAREDYPEKVIRLIEAEARICEKVRIAKQKAIEVHEKVARAWGFQKLCEANADKYSRDWTERYDTRKREWRDNMRQTKSSEEA